MDKINERPIEILLNKYSESHLHPVNELVHFICVPAIMFATLGLLWNLHPFAALGLIAVSLVYYFRLSVPFTCGMILVLAAITGVLYCLPPQSVFPLSITVFIVAWIGQFIGHKIEGKKPAFFDDLRFFLIGPLFVLGFLYRRLDIAY